MSNGHKCVLSIVIKNARKSIVLIATIKDLCSENELEICIVKIIKISLSDCSNQSTIYISFVDTRIHIHILHKNVHFYCSIVEFRNVQSTSQLRNRPQCHETTLKAYYIKKGLFYALKYTLRFATDFGLFKNLKLTLLVMNAITRNNQHHLQIFIYSLSLTTFTKTFIHISFLVSIADFKTSKDILELAKKNQRRRLWSTYT